MNLVTLLDERAAAHPERPALADFHNGRDRVVTFGELARRVSAGGARLSDLGLRRGQTVLAFHPVSIELYEFLLAAFRIGLRVMLADPSAGRPFISACCQRLMPDGYFGSWKAQFLRLAVPELRRVKKAVRTGPWFPRSAAWDTASGESAIAAVTPDEPALITFTSGSTGQPKAAVRSHGFLLAQHRALSHSLDFEDAEVDLITLPVFVLANLASGLTSVLAATDLAKPGAPDATAVREQCRRHGVTRCAASPAFFEALLHSPGGPPPLLKLYTGGAPVLPNLLRRLAVALPACRVEAVYGSTEAEPIAHAGADQETAELTRNGAGLHAGLPVPEIKLRIIRDHWGTPLGPLTAQALDGITITDGQAGEIIVSGDHVLPGYLDGMGDTETKIHVNGRIWHRTGDAGWIDPAGHIWLLGRAAEKLPPFPAPADLPREAFHYPFAIECALRERFPAFRMAALEWNGERILAVEKVQPGANFEDLTAQSSAFGISRVAPLPSIPLDRRHNAKVDYPSLKELLNVRKMGN